MSYQAVVRDAGNNLVVSSNIGVQVSILQGEATGTAVYVERHFPATNSNGLVTLEIGTGTVVSGDFSTIDWADDSYFIKAEIDLNGGANYTISATSQLLSVPYALHANKADALTDGETDPEFNAWDKSTGISITESQISDFKSYLTDEIDGSVTNEIQDIGNVLIQGTDAGAKQIKNIANPTAAQDAATKAYVDEIKESIFDELLDVGLNGVMEDSDGNRYATIKIGNQVWMAENLKVTKESNGTAIPLITDNTEWANLGDNNTDKAYCYYSNSVDSLEKYGALYTYAAALVACPAGWHLPSDAEWTELENYISNDGYSGTEGTALKSSVGWVNGGNGTNDYRFGALPGGIRDSDYGTFYNVGNYGYWWSATESNSSNAGYRSLNSGSSELGNNVYHKSLGLSVRCLSDY
jgi:uncharacterized protein (TIGR02145 family)